MDEKNCIGTENMATNEADEVDVSAALQKYQVNLLNLYFNSK